MPPKVELVQDEVQGGLYYIRIYVQPTFVNTGRSQRVQVISPVALLVQQRGEEHCDRFQLGALGSYINNPEAAGLAFNFESAPAPLVVTYEQPSTKVLSFGLLEKREEPYFVGEGTYLLTLAAKTGVKGAGTEDLRTTLEVASVGEEELRRHADSRANQGVNVRDRFLSYPVKVIDTSNACSDAPE